MSDPEERSEPRDVAPDVPLDQTWTRPQSRTPAPKGRDLIASASTGCGTSAPTGRVDH